MKVAELLAARQANWSELEQCCRQLEGRRRAQRGELVARFATLYRAACADLALADAYQLPPTTVEYLHVLVGRAHNQMYRSRTFQWRTWGRELFQVLPRRLFRDNCLRLALVVFWGLFLACMGFGYASPRFAERLLGDEDIREMETSFAEPISGRAADANGEMAGFYVWHNASIGLQCFAAGLLFGVGGLFLMISNAAMLGAAFGYMATTDQRENFFHFVTAHAPFELTAIVLAGGAGMRLGFALIDTGRQTRSASLRHAGREAVPAICASIALFCVAGMIEAFISPSELPYAVKALVAVISTAVLLFYLVALGYSRGEPMQLDKTRIAIRERPFFDILDLALRVIRAHAEPLVLAWLVGTLPLALLNAWLLAGTIEPNLPETEVDWGYLWHLALLMIWEIPLATALISLFLGHALFVARPSGREITRQFFSRLAQLLTLQGLLRGGLAALAVGGFVLGSPGPLLVLLEFVLLIGWFFAYVLGPYLNEILLLERNPLFKRAAGGSSTLSRAQSLHNHAAGMLIGRWFLALWGGGGMTLALWLAMHVLRAMLTANWEFDRATWMLLMPAAGWIVIGYFAVVRFLSYLDLRIRTEGWEVELMLRAEGARLARQLV